VKSVLKIDLKVVAQKGLAHTMDLSNLKEKLIFKFQNHNWVAFHAFPHWKVSLFRKNI
jgi:hypothetical protein